MKEPPWKRDPLTWTDKESRFMDLSARWYANLDNGEISSETKAARFERIERELDGIRNTCDTIPKDTAVAPRW